MHFKLPSEYLTYAYNLLYNPKNIQTQQNNTKNNDFIVKKLLKYDEERNSFIERYKKYSLVLGKDIKYTKNNTEFYGTALDIDKDGGLIVKSGNSMAVLKSGEISLYL